MPKMNQFIILFLRSCLLCLVMTMITGCQFMPHALQPNQLRKLNRGPALGRDSYNFSIKDPAIPQPELSSNEHKQIE